MLLKRVLPRIKRIITRKRVFILILLFVAACSLFHNDRFYDFFKESINRKLTSILRINILEESNKIAHSLDLVGGVKRIAQPLNENDYFEILIAQEEQDILNSYLLSTPPKKKWVPIKIKINNKYQLAKLKYHGTHPNHYLNKKYSYTIKLDKDSSDYIDNYRRFKLIKGEDVNPTVTAINQLANSLGLISTSGEMKMVKINGIDKGHYYFVEDIKKEYLERELGITNYALLINVGDWTRKESKNAHSSDNDLYFGHIEKRKNPLHPQALNQYKILTQLIQDNNLNEVKNKFDIDYMGKFLALASVFNDIHFMAGDNLRLIYDFNRGKFYPVYRAEYGGRVVGIYDDPYPTGTTFVSFNKFLFHSLAGTYFESPTTKVFKILLADNDVRNARDKYLYLFVKNKKHLINHLNNVHLDNEKIMLRCESRRNYDHEKRNQISVANTTLDLGKQYLNYGHIYGSYDSITNNLHLLVDAFVPINIYHEKSELKKLNVNGIELDSELNLLYNYQSIVTDSKNFKLKKLKFINSLTKDTIDKKHIHINIINTSDRYKNDSTIIMLRKNHINFSLNKNEILIKQGTYTVKTDIVVASNFLLTIQKGVTLKLDKDINFCVKGNININGTKNSNVNIINLDQKGNFGTFSILGSENYSFANIDYLNVSGGSSSFFMGQQFTSQFAIYHSNVSLKNSSFTNCIGDDGLNVKYSKIAIDNCKFYNNRADQVDLDFCFAIITSSTFSPSKIDSNGDGLDLSGSYAQIRKSDFSEFLDKGLSLGEQSKVLVISCSFDNNKIAIGVKDQTQLFSWGNKFELNEQDYYAFIKKKIFNAPELYLSTNDSSKIVVKHGNISKLSAKEKNHEEECFQINYKKYRANNQLSNLHLFSKLIYS